MLNLFWLILTLWVNVSFSRLKNCIDSWLGINGIVIILLGQLVRTHLQTTCLNKWDHLSDFWYGNHVTSCEVKEFLGHFRLLLRVFFYGNSRSGWLSWEIAREILFVAVFEIVPGRNIRFIFVFFINFKIVVGVLDLRIELLFLILEYVLWRLICEATADRSSSVLTIKGLFG